ncbi:hypothetical protein HFA01_08810 [Halobacillus faecis]|uniref:Uncharacterized protein n=1 Tax=Halobacillus faecis TaxID=360184 RepID=A0A511WN99_9BACI|nr:hypothetical protein HFA01_08810 [Halobacillus faecis]
MLRTFVKYFMAYKSSPTKNNSIKYSFKDNLETERSTNLCVSLSLEYMTTSIGSGVHTYINEGFSLKKQTASY